MKAQRVLVDGEEKSEVVQAPERKAEDPEGDERRVRFELELVGDTAPAVQERQALHAPTAMADESASREAMASALNMQEAARRKDTAMGRRLIGYQLEVKLVEARGIGDELRAQSNTIDPRRLYASVSVGSFVRRVS